MVRRMASRKIKESPTGRFVQDDFNFQNIPLRTEVGKALRDAFIDKPRRDAFIAKMASRELNFGFVYGKTAEQLIEILKGNGEKDG